MIRRGHSWVAVEAVVAEIASEAVGLIGKTNHFRVSVLLSTPSAMSRAHVLEGWRVRHSSRTDSFCPAPAMLTGSMPHRTEIPGSATRMPGLRWREYKYIWCLQPDLASEITFREVKELILPASLPRGADQ